MFGKLFKSTTSLLTSALLLTALIVPAASAQSVDKLQVSAKGKAWGIGTKYETAQIDLQIKNNYGTAGSTIKSWVLEFDFAGQIKSVAGAVVTEQTGNRYKLKGTTKTDLVSGETLNLKIESALNGAKTASFRNITLRPETAASKWVLGASYKVNDVVEHKGKYYRAIQAHQVHVSNWTPDQTPALWSSAAIEGYNFSTSVQVSLEVIESWKLNGVYKSGQIVFHAGTFYKCVTSHTAYAPNWSPGPYTKSLWSKTVLK
ncbi:hypothetical protein I6N90_12305 [Paenibacillus sp. GSMTC-2017]|uniref:carbohydrate-binding protein n=1 Tax=Paenibacillus sp. GSMTC-2017 TaxID=2794350 RepID=UPI0018D6680C|nr:carbohydrate-binding protein [Paenibacillus sp. GSMTC-2017]MBH5318578.1 hypothetical protein [Paenibacillus sp. GSMTC-2017]